MPKAILHVGTMKTGTTSIQATLEKNANALQASGFDYLGPPMRHSSVLEPALDALDTTSENLIISDEGIWHFFNTKRSDTAQLAKLLSGYDVTVLVYLRRPDDFLNSWFQQGLKSGTGSRTMTEFLGSSFVRSGMQFENTISRFDALFGEGSVCLRPYEKSQLYRGDAVSDFLNTVGLPVDEFEFAERANTTPETDRLLLRSMMRKPTSRTQRMTTELDRLDQHLSDNGYRGRRYSLLSHDELRTLDDTYRDVFRNLQEKFGGGESPDFFRNWIDLDGADDQRLDLRWAQEAILSLTEEFPVEP